MSAPKITLTYFDLEGVGEKIRLTLTIGGVPFDDVRIDRANWETIKPTTKYGQLPLLVIDDGAPIAQSGAMLRWAGRLTGLYPTDPAAQIAVDELIGLEEDLARALLPSLFVGFRPTVLGHPADISAEAKGEIVARLRGDLVKEGGDIPRLLGYLEDALKGSASGFFVGDKPTIADCQLYPRFTHLASGVLDHIPPTILDGFPNIQRFIKVFGEIPAVAAYHAARAAAKAAKSS